MNERESVSSGSSAGGAVGSVSLTVPGGAALAGAPSPSGAVLRTDLLHRHLSARVAAARETLDILRARTPAADDELVHRFGARVSEAQRVLDAERAEAARRADDRLRAARLEAATIVIDAEGEARVLFDVAAQLALAPVEGADEVTVDLRDTEVPDPAGVTAGSGTVLTADPAAP